MFYHVVCLLLVTASAYYTPQTSSKSNFKLFGEYADYKYVLQRNVKSYVKAANTIPRDLTNVTMSLWARFDNDTSSYLIWNSNYMMYLYYYQTTSSYHGLQVGVAGYGYTFKAPKGTKLDLVNKWTHYVISYNGTTLNLWYNGTAYSTVVSSSYKNKPVKKGQWIYLSYHGVAYKSQREIAHMNIYPFYVDTLEQVKALSHVRGSDARAVLPWDSFINGTKTYSYRYKETEIPRPNIDNAANVKCSNESMILTLYRNTFPFLDPTLMSLRDRNCRVAYYNGTTITITAPLNTCGTTLSNTSRAVIYRNHVCADYTNRRVGALNNRFDVTCEYPFMRSNLTLKAYWISGRNGEALSERSSEYSFEMRLFHDQRYLNFYKEEEYPIDVLMKERVFVKVNLKEPGHDLCSKLANCTLNLSPDKGTSPQHPLIRNGLPVDKNVVLYSSTDTPQESRFSFLASALDESSPVYLHCNMDAVFCDTQGH